MANDRSKQDGGSGKVKRVAGAPAEPSPRKIVLQAERSGDWMPVDELRAAALAALEAGDDVSLHLDGIDHLDSSALQILLAFDADQKKQGRHLELANASPHLRQWFEYAGVPDHFSMTVPKTDD